MNRRPQQRQSCHQSVRELAWTARCFASLLPILLGLLAASANAGPSLNVLFIAVDDLNTRVGCYGDPMARTPHIDALAARGVRFDRAYCQYPVCNSSRISILTGTYVETHRILNNVHSFRKNLSDAVTLPRHFLEHGYVTLRAGKIFHGTLPEPSSWSIGGVPSKSGPSSATIHAENVPPNNFVREWRAIPWDGEGQADYRNATRAIEFLDKHHDQPFFLAVGFHKPHLPYVAPERFFELFDPRSVTLPVDFALRPHAAPDVPPVALLRGSKLGATPDAARNSTIAYYAAASFMDAQLGRVLESLDRHGLWENTIVVFFSDHGFQLGEKGMWAKNTLFEVSVRVPLIIVAPGSEMAGQSCPRTVELVDLYPTLCALCGLPLPEQLEGQSLVPLLEDPQDAREKPAFTTVGRGHTRGRTVRSEDWRYTQWMRLQPDSRHELVGEELYDERNDPHETTNLAARPESKETVSRLQTFLDPGWQKVHVDPP